MRIMKDILGSVSQLLLLNIELLEARLLSKILKNILFITLYNCMEYHLIQLSKFEYSFISLHL
jgi:hypothetical protein